MEFKEKLIYKSSRTVTYGKNGMVATSQNLAAQAGLDILKKGGNAIDAAIATAATLVVVEPTSNGFGGDAFAQIWFQGKLYGLNASGFAPEKLSLDMLRKKGLTEIPRFGWESVTIPGIPSAWAELSEKFGKLSLVEVLEPAIELAENGFAVSAVVARNWKNDFCYYDSFCKGKELYAGAYESFTKNGRTPLEGEIWKYPYHAETLREIGRTCGESFYRGKLAEKIVAFAESTGGYITEEDLAKFHPEWVTPISVKYRGYDVWELPPNGHGIVALMALNLLNQMELKDREQGETCHKIIEAMKLAYVDGMRYVTEPADMEVTPEELLNEEYAKKRTELITETACMPQSGYPQKGGTVYLCTADREGNMVSYIQSNYMDFGSCIVVPETGIAFHNRGLNFSLEESSANCLKPGKRPYHTIIPGFLSKDGEAVGPFGVMGDFMQPQGHVQVVTNMIDFHLNPQQSLDAPRWRWRKEKIVEVEETFPDNLVEDLKKRNHEIIRVKEPAGFGRGEIILRSGQGSYIGATESRADGVVAAW